MEVIPKQPSEEITYALQFRDKLRNGIALSAGSISAIDMADSSDATSTVLASTTMTISGTQALFKAIGGTDGKKYKLTALVTLSNSDVLEEDVMLYVGAK